MFHLMPIKLWRNVSSIMVLAAFLAAMAGTFLADVSIVVHWGENGMPNNSAGKWILWAMLLLSVLSMFSYSSMMKECPGYNVPVGREMACALSTGMVSVFSLVDVVLAVYKFYPVTAVPVIGTAAIVCSLILFVVTAYIRQHNTSRAGEEK